MRRDLSREELVDLVRRIRSGEGTETEQEDLLALLEANVVHPAVSDLVFWPETPNPTAEDIVDEALAYRPVLTPPHERWRPSPDAAGE